MNPRTGEFEELMEGSQTEQQAEAEGWPTFRVGEVIRLRGGSFEVERVTRNRLILKPVNRAEHIAAL